MNTERCVMSDDVWERIAPRPPGKTTDCKVTASDNRMFPESVSRRLRSGPPKCALPSLFGNWNSVFHRFHRWVEKGVFEPLFDVLSGEPGFEYALVDGAIVSVHQKASGAKGELKIRPSSDHKTA